MIMKKRKSKLRDSTYMFALHRSINLLSTDDLIMINDLINVELAKRNETLKEIKENE